MKKNLLILVLFCLSLPLFALTNVVVHPSAPRGGEDVEVVVGGTWPGALAGPSRPVVSIDGRTITIDLTGPPSGPISVDAPWAERVDIGPLSTGTYTIIVRINGIEDARQTLLVDDGTLLVAPRFGGEFTRVYIDAPLTFCGTPGCLQVLFGSRPATDVQWTPDGGVMATAPAGTGTVDVTVRSDDKTLVLRNGFRYGAGFEDDYERVLFPVTLAGRGANGSDWRSEIIVRNDGPVYVDTLPLFYNDPDVVVLPIPSAIEPGGRAFYPERETDGGAFMHVPQGLESWLSYSSHAIDRSRSDADLGTEIPVVRADDTAHAIRIVNVPMDGRYRATLRIYDFDLENGRHVDVMAILPNGTTRFVSATLTGVPVCPAAPCIADRPAFAAINLSGVPDLRTAGNIDLVISTGLHDARLWAFVSVTNNETQHVTVFTPQHDTE
jgi:hypothetical protein